MYVFTKLSRRLPFGVRKFLGTDVPGIGFAVHYHRQEDGAWFPDQPGQRISPPRVVLFHSQHDGRLWKTKPSSTPTWKPRSLARTSNYALIKVPAPPQGRHPELARDPA